MNKEDAIDILEQSINGVYIPTEELHECIDILKQQPASPGWVDVLDGIDKALKYNSEVANDNHMDSNVVDYCNAIMEGILIVRKIVEENKPPQHIACEQETGSQHIGCDLYELVQALTDSENQPHQWVGNPDRLRELITTNTEEA